MKHILILFFFLVGFSFANAQDGYKLIKKAKSEIRKENYDKALKLLKSAEKADYGWCGNSYYYAMGDIGVLKSEIYNRQELYDESLKVLDSYFSCNFGVDCNKRDSMRIETLFLKYGKESVVSEFKNKIIVSNSNTIKGNYMFDFLIQMPTMNYSFKLSFYDDFGITEEELANPKSIIENLPFYKLIEQD